MTADPYWNHNVHYHRTVLAAVPDGCRTALDVGCGDGLLARKLATRAAKVTGVDRSPEMIRLARERQPANVTFLEADYLGENSLDEGAHDYVSAVAVVHHARFEEAVDRLTRLVAPGGRLMIVGLAYNHTFMDRVISGCGLPVSRLYALLRGGKHGPLGMPTDDPAMHWGEVRKASHKLLPGCRFRRRPLWRYTLVWDKTQGDKTQEDKTQGDKT
ncbi:class I SAM-dependent methyltransferase [Streptomyces sp. NPDC101151]|uniref:class I SAM-dependent methyltransferase n=1 Tax=Streptomyces sp. NPDC101151 TaxID=3366115 RepID=UPI00381F8BF1